MKDTVEDLERERNTLYTSGYGWASNASTTRVPYLLISCAAVFSSTLTKPRASNCFAHSSTTLDNESLRATGLSRAAHCSTAFVLGLTKVIDSGSACAQAMTWTNVRTRLSFVSAFNITSPGGRCSPNAVCPIFVRKNSKKLPKISPPAAIVAKNPNCERFI